MASASSSASTTPMPLTPESTGAPPIALSASSSSNGGMPSSPTGEGPVVPKKARRQGTLFANQAGNSKPVKPFSRSAAKRESVMALGSIEHLQQYFTKTGMVNKKNPLFDKKHYGLVPAIGGMPLSPTATGGDGASTLDTILAAHPSPSEPAPRPHIPTVIAPHVKSNEAHPDTLLPGVIDQLTEMVKAWAIDEEGAEHTVDVLPLLRTTTRTIQTVRNYMLSLPDDPTDTTTTKGKRKLVPGQSKGHSSSTPRADGSTPPPDPLALIRRCSLEVLGTLRALEETARLPLTDDAYDAQSDGGGGSRGVHSRTASPSPGQPLELQGVDEGQAQAWGDLGITFSLVQVQGRYEAVPVWEDEEPSFDDEPPTKEKREVWHETLEVGNGWLYRQDITLRDVPREREAVKKYLDAVDDALFPPKDGQPKAERGWEIERKKLEIRTSRFASLVSNSGRSRSKLRRISSGEHLDRGNPGMQAASLLMDPTGGMRRISTGMIGLTMGERARLTAEPEDMEGIKEEGGSEEDEGGDEEFMDDELDEDELPGWAKREVYENDEIGRLYSFLHQFLPPSFQHELVPPSPSAVPPGTTLSVQPSRSTFLSSLSSGQLLCLAYNVCVRKSHHPWGFVSKEGIHDILSLEKAAAAEGRSSGKTGWTFRRTDNLRLWIGALKLRYMLPIQVPSQILPAFPQSLLQLPSVASSAGLRSQRGTPLSSPKKSTFPAKIAESRSAGGAADPVSAAASSPLDAKALPDFVLFDAQVVARKDDGWEDMLERVLLRWMWKAIGEKRKALPTPIG